MSITGFRRASRAPVSITCSGERTTRTPLRSTNVGVSEVIDRAQFLGIVIGCGAVNADPGRAGQPTLLATEDANQYGALLAELAREVRPSAFTEWLWVKDSADLTWDIIRYRRINASDVDGQFGSALDEPNATSTINAPIDAAVDELEVIERLLASVEYRRNHALHEIERRRNALGRALRRPQTRSSRARRRSCRWRELTARLHRENCREPAHAQYSTGPRTPNGTGRSSTMHCDTSLNDVARDSTIDRDVERGVDDRRQVDPSAGNLRRSPRSRAGLPGVRPDALRRTRRAAGIDDQWRICFSGPTAHPVRSMLRSLITR